MCGWGGVFSFSVVAFYIMLEASCNEHFYQTFLLPDDLE